VVDVPATSPFSPIGTTFSCGVVPHPQASPLPCLLLACTLPFVQKALQLEANEEWGGSATLEQGRTKEGKRCESYVLDLTDQLLFLGLGDFVVTQLAGKEVGEDQVWTQAWAPSIRSGRDQKCDTRWVPSFH